MDLAQYHLRQSPALLGQLLIREDITFLNQLLAITSSVDSQRSWIFSRKIFIALSAVIFSSLINLHLHLGGCNPIYLLFTTFTTSCFVLLGPFLVKFKELRIQWLLANVLQNMQQNRISMKNLYKLIDEIGLVYTKYGSSAILVISGSPCSPESLRNSFANACHQLFDTLRQSTIKIQEAFSKCGYSDLFDTMVSKSVIDLSQLPRETFDDLLSEQEAPSLTQLKCLIKLIRLQQSEFLRKVLSMLMINEEQLFGKSSSSLGSRINQLTLLSESDDMRSKNELFHDLECILKNVNACIKKTHDHMKEISSLVDSDLFKRQNRQKYTESQVNSHSQLLLKPAQCNYNRSSDLLYLEQIKFAIQNALIIVNGAIDKLTDDTNVSQETFNIHNLIKCIDDELLQSLSVLASYRKELAAKNASLHSGFRESQSTSSSEKGSHEAADAAAATSSASSSSCLPDYEVFQAEVSKQSLNHTAKQTTDDGNLSSSAGTDIVYNKRIGMAVSLHDELRFAIISKASEHRKREAAALGVSEDQVESLYLTRDSPGSLKSLEETRVSRRQEMDAMRAEMANRQREMMMKRDVQSKCGENDPVDGDAGDASGGYFHPSLVHSSLLAATSSIAQCEEHFGDEEESA